MRWIKDEEKIKKSKKGTKRVMFIRSAQFSLMEVQVHAEFRQLRRRGIKIKGWWFKNSAKQILTNNILVKIFLFQMAGLLVLKNAIKLA